MKNSNKLIRPGLQRFFLSSTAAFFALLPGAPQLLADAPPAVTSIRWTGTDFEGRSTYRLEWDADSNLVYRVQTRTGLESNATWATYDLVKPTGSRGAYDVSTDQGVLPPDAVSRGFFQVLQPQTEIFRIEPALLGTNGGTINVFGQCFGTNLTLRLGTLVLPPNPLPPGSPYSFSISPGALGEGVYDVEILDGTNVLTVVEDLFTVTGQPSSVGESAGGYARLLEPPDEPPASPYISASLLMPALMKAKEKANRTKCSSNLRTMPNGELQLCEVDFVIPGRGLDLVWARTYRSRTGTNTVMGQNWSHSYDISIWPDATGHLDLFDGTGRIDRYYSSTGGVWTADELFNVITETGGVFTVTFPDSSFWEFNSLSNAIAPGRIARSVDRNGNSMLFTYDGSSRLTEIIDTLDRTNRLTYGPTGRLQAITDFTGRTWTYTHWRQGQPGGSNGDLMAVTTPAVVGTPNGNDFPAGKTTTYTYSQGSPDNRLNHNLLTVTDPLAQEWLHVTYQDEVDPTGMDFDRVATVQRGANPPGVFTYIPQSPAAGNRWAVLKTIENDPVGNVTIDWFDSLNRGVIHRDIAARATAGVPVLEDGLPTKKLRETDPDFWETTYEWNADSLCTRVTYPRGNSTEVMHQRAQDHNSSRSNKTASRRSDGNPIVVRIRSCCGGGDSDDDGLVTRYTYDARFGSSRGHRIMFDDTEGREKFTSGPRQTTSMDGSRGFATSTTDPRGLKTTAEFDAQGNCVALTHQGRLLDGSDSPVTNFEHDGQGQLTAIVHPLDSNGARRRDEFEYASSYVRTWTIDTTGPDTTITSYSYDPVGNMTESVDPNGNTNRFIYNALDQLMKSSALVQCPGCAPVTEEFSYDANDNLVRLERSNQDHTGALDTNNPSWTTLYEYDVLNLRTLIAHELTHVVQQRFASNRFVYDANDNVIEEHSPEAVNGNQPGNYMTCVFDTRDLLFTKTCAPGTADASTRIYDYDENGNLSVDRSGNKDETPATCIFIYDGFDRLLSKTDAMGNVATFAYDGNDNLIYERLDGQTNDVAGGAGNRRLSLVRYEYDGQDRMTAERASFFDIFTDLSLSDGESTTTWAYAPDGSMKRVTDDNGHTTRYSYDSKGRIAAVSDAKTNLTTYLYDANDNVTQMKQTDRTDVQGVAQEFTETFQYDELDRCITKFDNVGNTEHFAYDSRGNLVRHLDARGTLQGWTFDGLSRMTLVSTDLDGDGIFDPATDFEASSVFDDNSRLVASRDANSNLTLYAYDALDRHVVTTNADRTTMKLIWSPRSNLLRTVDANGTVISNTFDLLDRCVRRDITPGGGVLPTTTFELFVYDGASQMMLASNDVSMMEFRYDSMGNRIGGKADCLAMAANFDGVGNRLSLTYPTGGVVQFTYDPLDQVSSVSRTAGGLTKALASFAYDGPGRPGRVSRGNNVNTRLAWNGMKNPPNAPGDSGWGRVSSVNHQFAGGGETIDRRIATYDPNQNKLLREQTVPFATGVPALTTNVFAYDALNRMTSFSRNRASLAQTKSLALDKNGNRQTVSSNGVVEIYTMDATTPEPADFQMNQYTGTPFGIEQHDLNGNLVAIDTAAGSTLFSYDYAGRLVLVQRTVGPTMVPVASFSYDALGRRISRTTFPDAPALPVTTYFVLDMDSDDDGILEERNNGELRRTWVVPHVLETSGRMMISPAGETLYTHVDEMGTAVALTDDGGNVLERYDYGEYGEPRFYTADGVPMVDPLGQPVASSPAGNHFLFNGMFWDAASSFYFEAWPCRWQVPELNASSDARYLNPKTGRRNKVEHWGDPHENLNGHNPWSVSAKEEGGRHTPFHNKVTVRGWDPEKKTAFAVLLDPDDDCDGVATMREAGSGMATGRRSHAPRDAASGQATGRRQYAPRDPASGLPTGKRMASPRDAASGLSTGRRSHAPRDAASGQATGRRTHSPRDAASGLATGKRQHSPRDSASGLPTGRRSYSPGHFILELDSVSRDSASGLPTGRRMHAPRDAASGLPTGRRMHAPRDAASGLATGRRQHAPRDPASGLPTGKRMSAPRDPATGMATGKRQ